MAGDQNIIGKRDIDKRFSKLGGDPEFLADIESLMWKQPQTVGKIAFKPQDFRQAESRANELEWIIKEKFLPNLESVGMFSDPAFDERLRKLAVDLGWLSSRFSDPKVRNELAGIQKLFVRAGDRGGRPYSLMPYCFAVLALRLHLEYFNAPQIWEWIREWANGNSLGSDKEWEVRQWWAKLRPRSEQELEKLPFLLRDCFLSAIKLFLQYVLLHRFRCHMSWEDIRKEIPARFLKDGKRKKGWASRHKSNRILCQNKQHMDKGLARRLIDSQIAGFKTEDDIRPLYGTPLKRVILLDQYIRWG